jgi:hypothetical protein
MRCNGHAFLPSSRYNATDASAKGSSPYPYLYIQGRRRRSRSRAPGRVAAPCGARGALRAHVVLRGQGRRRAFAFALFASAAAQARLGVGLWRCRHAPACRVIRRALGRRRPRLCAAPGGRLLRPSLLGGSRAAMGATRGCWPATWAHVGTGGFALARCPRQSGPSRGTK